MTYDPGYGQQPGHGNQPPYGGQPSYGPPGQEASSPYAADPSPVPDVSQPIGGFPPPPGPPMSGPPMGGPPMPGPPMSGPPMSGPPISGAPASPAYGPTGLPMHPGAGMATADPGPRPQTVTAAIALTFVGVALAFVGTVLTHLFVTEAFSAANTSGNAELEESLKSISSSWTFISAGINLVAAAGASICAIFSMRGSNGARITLAVLCGVFAGWKLTCGGYWAATTAAAKSEDTAVIEDAMPFLWGAVGIDFVLLLVALGILTLLLVGPSNRFFSPPKMPVRY
ncbi:MAG: hypothetical protein ACRDTM_07260 [Micromonosporaceae bacterium]